MFVAFHFSKILSSRPRQKRTHVGLFASSTIIINKNVVLFPTLCFFTFCFFWKNGNTKNLKIIIITSKGLHNKSIINPTCRFNKSVEHHNPLPPHNFEFLVFEAEEIPDELCYPKGRPFNLMEKQ